MILSEKRKHSSQLVPYSYYNCLIPDYFSDAPLHWHNEFEINYVISGSAEYTNGEERFVSQSGDIIIIAPNVLHSVLRCDGCQERHDTLVFSADMLGNRENSRCSAECIAPIVSGIYTVTTRITKDHVYYDEFKTTVENIFSCAKGNTPWLDMLLKSELMRFFWLLEDSGLIYKQNSSEAVIADSLRPAIEYINENFCNNITVEALAEYVHLSKSYFMNKFKKAAGVGAIEYITQLRVKKACSDIINGNKSVADIAFDCGFRNLSNFNRQFKKAVGCTPSEYKKLYKD